MGTICLPMIESKNHQITNDKRLRWMEMRPAGKAGLEIAKDAGRCHHVRPKNEISPWETSNLESERVTRIKKKIKTTTNHDIRGLDASSALCLIMRDGATERRMYGWIHGKTDRPSYRDTMATFWTVRSPVCRSVGQFCV